MNKIKALLKLVELEMERYNDPVWSQSREYIADDIAKILEIASMLSSAKVSKKVLKKYFNALDTELTDRIKSFLRNETNNNFSWISENAIILYDNSENYIVELVNIDLQSYDGLKGVEQRKNILMNIVNSRERNQPDVAFVSTFPVWLNIDNAFESFIRNIKARIVHSDYRQVKAQGEANITLLIKDEFD